MYLNMFVTGKNTAVVSSTDMKRNYKQVQELLNDNKIIVVTNRGSENEVDGIFISYSENLIEKLEDMIEDIEMENNRDVLIEELKKSYNNGNGKRTKLSDL